MIREKILLFTSIFMFAVISFLTASAQFEYKFDFGTGKVVTGYTQVTAITKYNEQRGYGFDYNTKAIARNRSSEDALHSDFCTSIGSMFFSVKVPQGNYEVTVTLGDAWRPSVTTIKAESRRLMVKEISTKAGQFKTVSFMVSVWDSIINDRQIVHLKPRERDKLDWDNKLTLEFSNVRPCVDAITIKKVDNATTVFLMGNSTVTDQSLEPWSCWGQMIPSFFKPGKIVFSDQAASGSTLRASIDRNRLAKVSSMLKPGDYLFVEFAHNDQKPGSGEKAYTTYNKYLRVYIDSARAHHAIPVFVTSTNRHDFDASGKVINTLGEFPDAMRYEAKKDGVALIDLNAMTKTLYDALGPEKSKELFVQFASGTFPGQEKTLADNTHFCDFGAYELAQCVVEGIKKRIPSLAKYLKNDLAPFNPAHPDNIKKWALPLTPMFTSIKPYGD
ncbi:MAG: rhamnogalacturonan acetylesterase [Chitinophagaceae bacterium]